MTENGTPDRWDIVVGHYAFCTLWYGGMGDPLYARLCRILRYFRPSPCGINLEVEEWDGAREVYLALCRKHGYAHDRTEEIRV